MERDKKCERIDIHDVYFHQACKIRSVLLSVHADFFFHLMRNEHLTLRELKRFQKILCDDFINFFKVPKL